MSGDDVRVSTAEPAVSDALCRKAAAMAKFSDHINDAMTVVLRARMQTGQI
jgi:hypothetical protein